MAGRVPVVVRRCVRAVAQDKGVPLDRAFAICVAQAQKAGHLKTGSLSATKRGKTAGRSKSAQDGAAEKTAEYEKLLAAGRKQREESTVGEGIFSMFQGSRCPDGHHKAEGGKCLPVAELVKHHADKAAEYTKRAKAAERAGDEELSLSAMELARDHAAKAQKFKKMQPRAESAIRGLVAEARELLGD